MGVSDKIVDVIADYYSDPKFFVVDKFSTSDDRIQSAGIRQGCPLSPYLFILVMSCIDSDIGALKDNVIKSNRTPGINFDSIYFADDTILFSQNPAALKKLI